MYKLGTRSKKRLEGVHEDMVKVVELAIQISEVDFTVTDGLRSLERQKELFKSGATKTMNSRHLTGHAVDLAAYIDNSISWDWAFYEKISKAMKEASKKLGIPIEWGGDWTTFKDGPHFQLPFNKYKA
jgi:peptidoglycan L-alanyl-D-glutamate endopeptidase CwlK